MGNPVSYKEALDAGLSLKPLTLNDKTKDERDECPDTANSCEKIYSGCCVPRMGKIVLAQQWVVNKKTNKFTIHGLWPNNCLFDKSPEDGCDTSRIYKSLGTKLSKNTKLYDRLLEDMPSDQKTDLDHWKHQWEKHGTCLSTVENKCVGKNLSGNQGKNPGDDAIRYFRMTLDLYDEYNIMKKFRKEKIKPSNSPYPKKKILKALSDWKGYMTLHCVNLKLKEIHFYFYGAARNNFIPRGISSEGNCSDYIYLPVQADRSSLWGGNQQKPYLIGGRDP